MTHIIRWEARDNGALAFLAGAPLAVLTALDLYADEYGNTWASSSSKHPRALNRATGYKHSTIVAARRLLKNHYVIEPLARDVVRKLYEGKTHQPPHNAYVWHITCVVRWCDDPDCNCHTYLVDTQVDLYYTAPPPTGADLSENQTSHLSENQTSLKIRHEVNTSKDTTKKNHLSAQEADTPPNGDRPLTDWQAFCQGIAGYMFGIDTTNKALVDANMGRIGPLASAIRKVHRALVGDSKATPSPEDVKTFVERWYIDNEVDLPLGEKSTPPHWSRLMAPGWRPKGGKRGGSVVSAAPPGVQTYE